MQKEQTNSTRLSAYRCAAAAPPPPPKPAPALVSAIVRSVSSTWRSLSHIRSPIFTGPEITHFSYCVWFKCLLLFAWSFS
jgi:hypothetical protein